VNVIDYIADEVERQGHDLSVLDGIERTGWMLNAWAYALRCDLSEYYGTRGPRPVKAVRFIESLGRYVEPEKNKSGFRLVNVWAGGRACPPPEYVPDLVTDFVARQKPKFAEPLDFYREFEFIHPFVDGNGRTGKILLKLNWVNGSLLNPIRPPDDFWGQPIRNP